MPEAFDKDVVLPAAPIIHGVADPLVSQDLGQGFFCFDCTGKDACRRLLELLHPSVNEGLVEAELGAGFSNGFSPERAARATLALNAGA